MAIKYNLDDNVYLRNRLQYHAASKVGIQTGQALAQAGNTDGHTITDTSIWTSPNSEFPKNSDEYKANSDETLTVPDLVANFKTQVGESVVASASFYDGDTTGASGVIWTNTAYPAVQLFEKVEMTPVQYSDNQAWQVLSGTSRVSDWVAPTAVKDGSYLTVPGYIGYFEAYNGSWLEMPQYSNLSYGWALAKGTWEFVFMAGMLILHPDYIPSKMGCSRVRMTAFKYVGEYLDEKLTDIAPKWGSIS